MDSCTCDPAWLIMREVLKHELLTYQYENMSDTTQFLEHLCYRKRIREDSSEIHSVYDTCTIIINHGNSRVQNNNFF